MNEKAYRSGFVVLIGRPNVGKSTLMNRLIGEKVAIVSNKPQTTRSRIMGIATGEGWQIVFLDTPGLHQPKNRLGEYMVKAANDAMEGTDAMLVMAEVDHIGHQDEQIIKSMGERRGRKILVLSKTDLVDEHIIFEALSRFADCGYDAVIPVSSLTGQGTEELVKMLVSFLPEGPQYFPDDMITDQPERVLCAEIIREKALRNLRDEVPHGIGVEIMRIREVSEQMTEIFATIYCERSSHKGIIIGKKGAMLQKIGKEARQDIEKLLDRHVNLQLWVKVREDWRDNLNDLRTLGYDEKE